MDYEKKYKEAVKAIKELSDSFDDDNLTNELGIIFPELKESEDERIRKYLITYFSDIDDCASSLKGKDVVAWLKKQGEHANFRNKIQIGDKVTRNEDGVLINLSRLKRMAKKDEKQGEQKPIGKPTLDIEIPFGMDSELVEETMTIPKGCYAVIEDNKVVIRKGEKPAEWSEEDFNNLKGAISLLAHPAAVCTESNDELRFKIIDWLKSLRPQNTWKPSETDIRILEQVIDGIANPMSYSATLRVILEYLKKLKG